MKIQFFLVIISLFCFSCGKSSNNEQITDSTTLQSPVVNAQTQPSESNDNSEKYTSMSDFNDTWLVILSGSENMEESIKSQDKYPFPTYILNSAEFDNLNPGWFIVVASGARNKDEAAELSNRLKKEGHDNYIKFAGTYAYAKNAIKKFNIAKFGFVVCSKYIPLTDDYNDAWCKNKFTTSEYAKAISEADLSTVPEGFKRYIGEEFIVYDEYGTSRIGKISGIKVIIDYVPHFGFYQRVEDEKLSEEEIIETHMETGAKKLVAELSFDPDIFASCAQIKSNAPFKFYKKTDVKEDAALMAAFQSSDLFLPIREEFDTYKKEGNNQEYPDLASWTTEYHGIQLIHFSSGSELYASLRVYGDDRQDFSKNMLTVWKFEDEKYTLIYENQDNQLNMNYLVDINQDNKPEMLLFDTGGYYLVDGVSLEISDEYTFPYLDCPY